MTAKVPTSASGTITLGIIVAQKLRRKTKITITTSAIVSTSVNCTSLIDARIVVVRSLRMSTFTAGGIAACNCGRTALMRSTVSTTLAPQIDSPLAIGPGRLLGVFRALYRLSDIADTHRGALLVGDDDVVPRFGAE